MLNKRAGKFLFRIILIVAIIFLAFWLSRLVRENTFVQELVSSYGYIGALIISFVSGFNLAVPIPAVAFLPLFLESGLSLWPTLLVMTAGMTLADVLAYLLGRAGRHLTISVNQGRLLARLEKLRERYRLTPIIVLFLFAAFVPFPNEILVVPLAFSGYQLRRLVLAIFLGNWVFNAISGLGLANLFGNL